MAAVKLTESERDELQELLAAQPPCTPDDLWSHVAAIKAAIEATNTPEVKSELQDALTVVGPAYTLQKSLEAMQAAAETWLIKFPPAQIASDNSPNKKPLVKHFLSDCTHLWRMLTGHFPTKSEYEIFAKLLAAAWKDLGLDNYDTRSRDRRTKEYRWFRDRLDRSKNLIHHSF